MNHQIDLKNIVIHHVEDATEEQKKVSKKIRKVLATKILPLMEKAEMPAFTASIQLCPVHDLQIIIAVSADLEEKPEGIGNALH